MSSRADRLELPSVLRELGANPLLVTGWRTHARPPTFSPQAVMAHWTATAASAFQRSPMPTLNVVRNGWGSLPGPLYNVLVGRDGRPAVVSIGTCNHAGRGSQAAYDVARANGRRLPWSHRPGPDTFTANRFTWGVSADHPGAGSLSAVQRDGLVIVVAAVLIVEGRSANCAYHHAASTVRKVDVRGWPDLVPLAADRMRGRGGVTPPPPPPPPPDPKLEAIMALKEVWVGPDPDRPDDPREHVWLVQRDLGAPGAHLGYYAWLNTAEAAHWRNLARRSDRPDVVEAGSKAHRNWFRDAGLIRKK